MASIKNYPGTLSPILSYGSDKFYGPTQYRVVSLHNNSSAPNECINNYKGRSGRPAGAETRYRRRSDERILRSSLRPRYSATNQ